MIKYSFIFILIAVSIWQVFCIRTLHQEVDCMGRMSCPNCIFQSIDPVMKNYFSAIDSIDVRGDNFIEQDLRHIEYLRSEMIKKSRIEFRPYLTEIVSDDNSTSFQVEIGQFKKISNGYIYSNGVQTEFTSNQCLPTKFDSLVAYDVTGRKRKMVYP